jgi:multidrug efflux system outer membrane protein
MAQVQEELVTVAEKAVANAKAHREYVARAVAVGTQPELTRLKAETELVKRQSDLVKAQSELARGRWALGALLGRQAPVHVVVDETIPREAPTVNSMVFEDALKLRPELRLEDTRKEVARAQGLAAKLLFVPQVSASAAWFASTEPYPTGLRSGWRLTLDAVWSIYDGGMRESRVAQSMATEAAATAAKTSRQIQVVQEITDAAREIVVSQERLRLAEEQVHFAKEAAASANRSFTAGLVGSLDVLDANDRLYQADVSLAEAKGRLGVAFTNYNLARGY